jgi:hypothetical protein
MVHIQSLSKVFFVMQNNFETGALKIKCPGRKRAFELHPLVPLTFIFDKIERGTTGLRCKA